MEFYVDLYKSVLNTAKLVKKMVQVRGKNGMVFNRMQWVNPQEASTGHGVRQIKSAEGLKQAHKDGIEEHPHYQQALKEQGVDLLNHKDDHPHFFLPETYDSAANAEHREVNNELHEIVKEHEHSVHHPHGDEPLHHKMRENVEGEFDEDKFKRDHGIHPEIHDIMKVIDAHEITEGLPISRTLDLIGRKLIGDHKHTIKNHISTKIKEEAGDKFVENVQKGALKEGNTSNYLSMVASHPQIAKHVIHKILGKGYADVLRKDLEEANLSVNFPEKHTDSIAKNGYTASTMMDYIKNHLGEGAVEEMDSHISSDEFHSEGAKIDAITDLDSQYNWYDVQERAEAEYRAIGITLEDRKPTYIALNHINNATGATKDYGNSWLKIKDEKGVLNHCTATFDDSFSDTKSVAKIFDMDHLKDMYILKAIDRHHHLQQAVNGEEAKPWYSDWGIPIELQYHQPSLSPDQFEVQDEEKPESIWTGMFDNDDLEDGYDIEDKFPGLKDLVDAVDLDDLGDLEAFDDDDLVIDTSEDEDEELPSFKWDDEPSKK